MKKSLSDRFKMQDLGQLHHFLGIKVLQNLVEGKVWMGQPKYVQKLLERYAGLKTHEHPFCSRQQARQEDS